MGDLTLTLLAKMTAKRASDNKASGTLMMKHPTMMSFHALVFLLGGLV